MRLTLKIKLLPDEAQFQALKDTMSSFNTLCNDFSQQAFEHQTFEKNQLQKIVYHSSRAKYPHFSSQLTIRAIDVVSCSYKKDRRKQRHFRSMSAVVYNDRVLSYLSAELVSIWTINGRLKIPVHVHALEKFDLIKGQSDLILSEGHFYLLATLEVPAPEPITASKYLGVDLGVVNIATDSTGEAFSSERIEKKRKQYSAHRRRLQRRATPSAKRRIRKAGKKEACFRKDINHTISKRIVAKAKGTLFGVALEDLTHIRSRVTVRKSQRSKNASWSFHQLRFFIEYKAMLAGIPLVRVDPAYTSRTCSVCGHNEKKNRKSQSEFCCVSCGHTEHADVNAAKNIAFRAAVNPPIVSASMSDTSPAPRGRGH